MSSAAAGVAAAIRVVNATAAVTSAKTLNGGGRLPGLAVVQMCSTNNIDANFSECARLVSAAKSNGADFVCVPEAFDLIGMPGTRESVDGAEALTSDIAQRYFALAAEHNVWLSLGGFHQQALNAQDPDQRIRNTHCIVNAQGKLVASYDKIHLFDVDYDGGFKESTSTRPGESLLLVRDTPVGTIGVTTCYDLRFPEVYTALRHAGADVLLVPSAFMPTTGAAHWEVLLRARAIETQCYVAAAAQCGAHNGKRSSYGHSLLVDPFGVVLCDLGGEDQGCVGVCEVDMDMLQGVRDRMPVVQHRQATDDVLSVVVGQGRLEIVSSSSSSSAE